MTYTEQVKQLFLNSEQLVREALQAERIQKMTKVQLDYIYENELFHLLVPKDIGGAELDLPSFARLMERFAEVDGAIAWVINLGAGANMFSGFMEKQAARDIFSNKRTCVAGSGAATGTALSRDGSFVIDGHWKYASGSAHANWFSLNAMIDGGDTYKSFLVPRNQVEILDTWHVYGLKATTSCDFKIANALVPSDFQFDLQNASDKRESPLYRFPFMILAEINMLVMLTGMTMNFSKKVLQYTSGKSITLPWYDEEICRVKESRDRVFEMLDMLWAGIVAGTDVDEKLSRKFSVEVNEAANLCRMLVDKLYVYTGMSAVFEGNEISRIYRDFKVASQHGLLFPRNAV
ncbi:hypothetical protein [Albibacterium profundi]|uniref:Acyl-CoA dehydrogenase C-terminal domain-containing protein n=1 Tax=Albibacterium profundi TaxID=3134906 RepID=A0ABV5CFU7_9SPHI